MVKDFLHSDKKIYDPIHGFIPFDEFEKELIDSLPFQRLHYIHQLGISYLVYPGATHTRFEHSIGVMSLATQMFDRICKSVRPDAFQFVPRKGSSDYLYWRRVLRMAALCHDLGHLPFSHVAENDLLGPLGHEEWTLKIIESPHLSSVWEKLYEAPTYLQNVGERNLIEDVKKVALGEQKWQEVTGQSLTAWERIMSEIITGDFFGADRIDFLVRDARSTGVSYGLFDYHQLIETVCVLPSLEREGEFQLGIDANGLESCEALLLARHFMYRRVYQYSSVKAYNFHLRRYMKANYSPANLLEIEQFLALSDTDVISALNKAAKDPHLPGHMDAQCVIFRQHRFRAIALPPKVTEKILKQFQNDRNLSDSEIDWEFAKKEPAPSHRLCFPVSKRHVLIQKAKDCSDLLVQMPTQKTNWVYISPQHDLELIYFLEKYTSAT